MSVVVQKDLIQSKARLGDDFLSGDKMTGWQNGNTLAGTSTYVEGTETESSCVH